METIINKISNVAGLTILLMNHILVGHICILKVEVVLIIAKMMIMMMMC